ncbi:hypothetical protein FKP32DRAFT_1575988 [Trametes sanguinea]|nr:hypothetical protein FKP32DRAFT_1575988 [Trametes sanguinea]
MRSPFWPPETSIEHFEVTIAPRVALHVGQKVTVHEIVACDNLFPTTTQSSSPLLPSPPHFTLQDAEIEGTVVEIRPRSAAISEVVVRNEKEWSNVAYAYLAAPHIQGVTVDLTIFERILRQVVILLCGEDSRSIPLERNAIVLRNEWRTINGRRVRRAVGSYSQTMDNRRRAEREERRWAAGL